jgi:hypothetical protein
MIILRLRGGLGNQFFQFAAGKALAEHHNTAFKLDLYYYTKHPYRTFQLDKFNIPIEIASRKEVHHFTGSNPVMRILNKYNNYFHCPEVFAQPHYHFYEDFFSLPGNLYLSGYFQCEKYFLDIRSKILDWYKPLLPLDVKNQDIAQRIRSCNSVSLHIRRGDYALNDIFGSVADAYYKSAITYIQQHVTDPHFFIFSDDVAWCKDNLKVDKATFVDINKDEDSYKDLMLMSYCNHNIIANSTFSWWGAWLNPNSSKIVLAPKQWFKATYNSDTMPMYPARLYNAKDIIPEGWIKL